MVTITTPERASKDSLGWYMIWEEAPCSFVGGLSVEEGDGERAMLLTPSHSQHAPPHTTGRAPVYTNQVEGPAVNKDHHGLQRRSLLPPALPLLPHSGEPRRFDVQVQALGLGACAGQGVRPRGVRVVQGVDAGDFEAAVRDGGEDLGEEDEELSGWMVCVGGVGGGRRSGSLDLAAASGGK